MFGVVHFFSLINATFLRYFHLIGKPKDMRVTKRILIMVCCMALFMNTQCDDDEMQASPCDQTVVVDAGFYETAETDVYEYIGSEIVDNCLTIEIAASGCDGHSWSMVLVDSGSVAESLPEQRYLKFVFGNDETCLAVFSRSRSFDLTALQVEGSNDILLNIEGFPEPLLYSY